MFGWQSNEDAARLTLVCKRWRLPAEHVLYNSVALLSQKDAAAFLWTASTRLDLVAKVLYLVVGLSEEETWPYSSEDSDAVDGATMDAEEGEVINLVGAARRSSRRNNRRGPGTQVATSALMVEALGKCPNLLHFQLRPLHDSIRESLFATLSTTSLESLICSPRLRKPDVDWTGCFFRRSDISTLALPTLKNFELDAWTSDVDLSLPLPPLQSPPFRSNYLITLRLRVEISDSDLFALLTVAGPTLQNADIYVERLVAVEPAALALSHSLASLQELRWTTNPPVTGSRELSLSSTPLFDRLLPSFEKLQRLCISATDVSSSLLALLPPCLVEVEVRSLTYLGPFRFGPIMLKTLDLRSINFKLKRFVVYDSEEVWNDQNVAAMTSACNSRVSTSSSPSIPLLH